MCGRWWGAQVWKGGGKNKICHWWAGKFRVRAILEIPSDPPAVNNDRSLTTVKMYLCTNLAYWQYFCNCQLLPWCQFIVIVQARVSFIYMVVFVLEDLSSCQYLIQACLLIDWLEAPPGMRQYTLTRTWNTHKSNLVPPPQKSIMQLKHRWAQNQTKYVKLSKTITI